MYYFDIKKDYENFISIANAVNPVCDKDTVIGHGTRGICFKINDNTALKLTSDLGEVTTAITLIKNQNDAMPKVKSVYQPNDSHLWVIEQDLCENLTPKEYRLFDRLTGEFDLYSEDLKGSTVSKFEEMYDDGGFDHFEEDDLVLELLNAITEANNAPLLKELDLHVDNIMRLNGKLVLIDQKNIFENAKSIKMQNKIITKHLSETNQEYGLEI